MATTPAQDVPATPPPDDKDWTWVLREPCPQCGVSVGEVAGSAVAGRICALTDPDGINRQLKFLGNRDQNSAAGRTIELGHDQTRHASTGAKHFNLRKCVLPRRRIQNKDHVMRRCRINLFEDARDLF